MTLLGYELRNVLRARWLAVYALVFAGFTAAALQFGDDPGKAILSLESLTLLVVPLVSVLYAAIYWYNGEAFTQLLLTQPLRRSRVFFARWAAISLSLVACYALGAGASFALWGGLSAAAGLLLALGSLLTVVFVGLGLLVAVAVDDRMKGIGLALVIWLYCSLLHDALVFFVFSAFRDYPVEGPGLALMALNPVDLARVLVLLTLDLSAMMGYTGRILQKTLSGPGGAIYSCTVLAVWTVAPVLVGIRRFKRKNL